MGFCPIQLWENHFIGEEQKCSTERLESPSGWLEPHFLAGVYSPAFCKASRAWLDGQRGGLPARG